MREAGEGGGGEGGRQSPSDMRWGGGAAAAIRGVKVKGVGKALLTLHRAILKHFGAQAHRFDKAFIGVLAILSKCNFMTLVVLCNATCTMHLTH